MQAADDEIQIFVAGASKRESAASTDAVSDVLSTVCVTPGSGADVEVPCSSELQNTSLDTSITPKASSSCGDDVCSTTIVGEDAGAVVAEDDVHDSKPLSPPSPESRDANEQPFDAADEQFFSSSEGESVTLVLHVHYAVVTSELKLF